MFNKRRTSRGLTAVEMLVAMLMAITFLGTATVAFIKIARATDVAERNVRAVNNARAALQIMAAEFRAAKINLLDREKSFYGLNEVLPYGDGWDNDYDGRIDEEMPNAYDDDGDWQDNHAAIGPLQVRPLFVGRPDLGDFGVDEDCRFNADRVRFYSSANPDPLNENFDRESTYFIGSFDGEDHVLLKTSDFNVGRNPRPKIITEPLAFDVVSFNVLYYNANVMDPALGGGRPSANWPPYWVENWDSSDYLNFDAPYFPLPAAVRMEIEIYTGKKPLADVPPGSEITTVRLSTTVSIEQITNTVDYERIRSFYPLY